MESTGTRKRSLIIIGCLFFIFGFITWLNATLIPFLQTACELDYFQSYLVTFSFYIAYFVFAIPSSYVLKNIGMKKGISVGLIIMACGAALFIPAAIIRSYFVFLSALFTMGAGLTLLQTAANPYAAILGSPETAARRISLMGICSKVAGAFAPFLLGSLILKDIDQIRDSMQMLPPSVKETLLNGLAINCIPPYVAIVVLLLGISILTHFSSLPEVDPQENEEKKEENEEKSVWRTPALLGAILALFFYVGAEVISIDSLIPYASHFQIGELQATRFPFFSMFFMIVGYLVGIVAIPRFLSQVKVLSYSAFLGILLSILSLILPKELSLYSLVFLGLANAMIWPCIWGLAIAGRGKQTGLVSSLLVMSIAGGAIIPLVYGKLADIWDLRWAYIVLLPCYSFIWLYAWVQKRKKIKQEEANATLKS